MFLVMSVIFAVAVFDSCVSQGGMGKNNYVASVVTDTGQGSLHRIMSLMDA